MTADELRRRVDNDISTVFDRADQERRAESVVDDQRKTMAMSNGRDGVDIRNIRIRIAQRLDVDGLGIILNRRFHFSFVVNINEGGADAVERQCVCQQVGGTAVDGLLSDNVLTGGCQGLDRIGDGCRAGGQSQTAHTAFQGRDAVFEDALCGVGQTAGDIAGIRQTETIGSMLRVSENI